MTITLEAPVLDTATTDRPTETDHRPPPATHPVSRWSTTMHPMVEALTYSQGDQWAAFISDVSGTATGADHPDHWVIGTPRGRTVITKRPNVVLLRKVLERIDRHPEEWDQQTWGVVVGSPAWNYYHWEDPEQPACKTAFCIAGHAAALSGWNPLPDSSGYIEVFEKDGVREHVVDIAERELSISGWYTGLFSAGNSRQDVQEICQDIAASIGEKL